MHMARHPDTQRIAPATKPQHNCRGKLQQIPAPQSDS